MDPETGGPQGKEPMEPVETKVKTVEQSPLGRGKGRNSLGRLLGGIIWPAL